MYEIRTVSSRGQVTIPAQFRKALGLKPKDKVVFRVENGVVRILPREKRD